jgi:hypothetical protein
MIREFVRLPEFEKQCKHMEFSENDIQEIENAILKNPAIGEVMKGTGGLRKFRIALENRGKSSGARVIYVDFASYEKTYLITSFSKNELDNLSPAERNELKILVKILGLELKKKV